MIMTAFLAGVRLLRTSDGAEVGANVIAVTVLVALCALLLALVVRRVRACAENAARHRPGAVVVPGYTTAEMCDLAAVAGASTHGWLSMGGSPVAVVVTADGFEVWGRADDAPRWVVRREPGAVAIGSGVYGSRIRRAVRLDDGTLGAVFVPAFRPLRATGGMVGDDVERAVAVLSGRGRAPLHG
ncbi:hypothetical protein ET495_15395 [Xylanimonas allomyrinae]|uniref:Uncharacterized protein n=1 Tax=Xylanimonas allomyrinae TaxID=2509459 RepID=A0A4P6ER51_9MICO|nr:hypothetical protein [Xylanimonas allomyrinae]QAY64363.1 hypothetical protein ET495_15395 [Xylanimonas allomyrinae]